MSRGRLFKGIDFAMGRAAAAQRDRLAGQASLFDMLGDAGGRRPTTNCRPASRGPRARCWPPSANCSASTSPGTR